MIYGICWVWGSIPGKGEPVWESAAIFHNKSWWELNVPRSGPEAISVPRFSADLSLGLNLQPVIATPIEHWESVIAITASLISLPAIFFPLTSLGWFQPILFPPVSDGGGRLPVASLWFCQV